jgi:SAM-dependent methyltransferase
MDEEIRMSKGSIHQRDIRADVARFYDLTPHFPNDVPFYVSRILRPNTKVLELGCGTGRVAFPLAQHGAHVHGIDSSAAMIAILESKRDRFTPLMGSVTAQHGDITNFTLERTFDLIVAPFRVMQNLASDQELDGLFRCIRQHLDPAGRCILNAFHPNRPREAMTREWCSSQEDFAWRVDLEDGSFECHERRSRLTEDPLVLYPDLIYRRRGNGPAVEEHTLSIAMRCHYPEELLALVRRHGFQDLGKWGGYAGEPYGAGPELVVELKFAE